jgi:hypothetical protein
MFKNHQWLLFYSSTDLSSNITFSQSQSHASPFKSGVSALGQTDPGTGFLVL